MTPHDLGLVIQAAVWAGIAAAAGILAWLAAVTVTVIRAARAGRELDRDIPALRKPAGPPCFPAIGARGGTAPMDTVGAEIDQMLGGE